jgi:NAD(P)-dependent dehydrogenase (short-subunit alcohol dehydrogenase family)
MKGNAGIVTGGAGGIGEAVVARLQAEGVNIVVADRDATLLPRISQSTRGDQLFTQQADVSLESNATGLIGTCVSRFGRLDFLVNCAGVTSPPEAVDVTSLSEFERVNSINLRGTFLMMRSAIGYMKTHGGGTIVNISSTAGIRPMPGILSYTASKWGVVGLTLAAALESARFGIRINVVCPGVTDTPMFHAAGGDLGEQMTKLTPLQRIGRPVEIANAIVWLLSDEASFVTGLVMPVDGGLSLI